MKRKIYLILALMMGLFSSCNDFLNLPPLNKITEDPIFGTEAGIEALCSVCFLSNFSVIFT